jgi:hypothetical protein
VEAPARAHKVRFWNSRAKVCGPLTRIELRETPEF